jgi:hypothetical protein
MRSAAYFHAKAEQCRNLLKLAADRQVIDQLRLWISDFETDAARARGLATSRPRTVGPDRAWHDRPE